MKARPIKEPKPVATITICGAIRYTVTEAHGFKKPTPEQIKNLHDLLNIDVVVLEEKAGVETEEESTEVKS